MDTRIKFRFSPPWKTLVVPYVFCTIGIQLDMTTTILVTFCPQGDPDMHLKCYKTKKAKEMVS
jgi:hypothetical protein